MFTLRPSFPLLRRFLSRAALTFVLTVAALAGEATPRFAHEASDLAPDKARFGTLPNGLRYVVRPNATPKERASLRLLVLAGSFMEKESERGLAHFLEHLAFNGSKHFPDGSMVETLQRLGLSFGADTNASTGFDRTVYNLELPDVKPETLAEGFRIFHDFAGGLDLAAEKIEKERPIILAEKRARDSVQFRQFVRAYSFVFGDALPARRMPIGEEAVIRRAAREEFVDFYSAWYRPERLVVVAVGDFDAAAVEAQIASAFGDLVARGAARAEPVLGEVPQGDNLRVFYDPDSDAANAYLTIGVVVPWSAKPDTVANRLAELPRELAFNIVNRRLRELSKQENSPVTGTGTGVLEHFNFARQVTIGGTCAPGKWREALALFEQELRRALEQPFSPDDLAVEVADMRSLFKFAAEQATTESSARLAQGIVNCLAENQVFTSPAQVRDLIVPALEKITAEQCHAALRELWAPARRNLYVSGNLVIEGDAQKTITEVYAASRARPVAAGEVKPVAEFAYTDFGPAGRVASREHVADLDVTLVRFANGVRLNLKHTDFKANLVSYSVRCGGGLASLPRNKPGLGLLLPIAFGQGGLGRHSKEELSRIHAGRMLVAGLSVGEDAFVLSGVSEPHEVLRELQLLCATFTDPGLRPEALRDFRSAMTERYAALAHSAEGPLSTEVPALLAGGDARFGIPPKDEVLARSSEEIRELVLPALQAGPVEIAIVGDVDLEAAIAAVAQTFGALPARKEKTDETDGRRLKLPAAPILREFRTPTPIDRGMVHLAWPIPDGRDERQARRFGVVATVLEDRLRVKLREELGGTYSPSVATEQSEVFANYGHLNVYVSAAPAQMPEIVNAIHAVAGELAERGLTEDEFQRAIQPLLTALRTQMRTNAYWLGGVLAAAQEKPELLDRARKREADYAAITSAEIAELARRYLPPARAHQVVCLPAVGDARPTVKTKEGK